jgi:hypothetical protein
MIPLPSHENAPEAAEEMCATMIDFLVEKTEPVVPQEASGMSAGRQGS